MLFDQRTTNNIMRNTKRRINTFNKNMSKDMLPTEQKEFQEYLKNKPTKYRKYDRKTKSYIPKMPRNISQEDKEQYLLDLNGYLNETTTFKELKSISKEVDSNSFSADELIDIKNKAKQTQYSYYQQSKREHLKRAVDLYSGDLGVIDKNDMMKELYNLNINDTSVKDIYDTVKNKASKYKNPFKNL